MCKLLHALFDHANYKIIMGVWLECMAHIQSAHKLKIMELWNRPHHSLIGVRHIHQEVPFVSLFILIEKWTDTQVCPYTADYRRDRHMGLSLLLRILFDYFSKKRSASGRRRAQSASLCFPPS